jgi:hypothetical protein
MKTILGSGGDYEVQFQGVNEGVVETLKPVPEADRAVFAREIFEFGCDMRRLVQTNGTVTAVTDQLKSAADSTRLDLTDAAAAVKKTIGEAAALHYKTLEKQTNDAAHMLINGLDPEKSAVVQKLLHQLLQKAQVAGNTMAAEILKLMNVNDPDSTMGAMDRKLTALGTDVTKIQAQIEAQYRAVRARAKSAAKGEDLEDFVGEVLGPIAAHQGESFERCGNEVGLLDRCKVGDYVTVLDQSRTRGQIARVVIEAKNRPTFKVPKLLEEMRKAQENRGAATSLGVLTNPEVARVNRPIAVYNNTQVIVSLPDFGEPDADRDYFAAILAAAYDLARLLVLTQLDAPVIETVDLDRITAHVNQIAASSLAFSDLKENHTKINSAVETAKATAAKIKSGIDQAVQGLRDAISAELLKVKPSLPKPKVDQSQVGGLTVKVLPEPITLAKVKTIQPRPSA